MADLTDAFPLGVIEGFFGRAWDWEARHDYAEFLRAHDFAAYLYAPKGDAWLRRQWAEPMPAAHRERLRALSEHYRRTGLGFGIGLSPFELYRRFDDMGRRQLRAKLDDINVIDPSILCLLFDDMPGDCPDLAQRQTDILDYVMQYSRARRFILCPTYYSTDPVLATHFGPMPAHYLEDLGRLVDPAVDIFWTGPKVISGEYPAVHLDHVGQWLRRKPLLWDNYPVNDGLRLTPFLHLRPFERDADVLRRRCAGHIVNPMNQAHLSRVPLSTLPCLYQARNGAGKREELLYQACVAQCGPRLGEQLAADVDLLQDVGLNDMNEAARRRLERRYQPFRANPFARELLDWLAGDYAFDPACLT